VTARCLPDAGRQAAGREWILFILEAGVLRRIMRRVAASTQELKDCFWPRCNPQSR
jgi:hypothetical protein